MQVVEILSKQTLDGEVTSYMVKAGLGPKLLISDVDGEIFDSADKAKSELIERATTSINRLFTHAVEKATEWYPGSFEAPSDDQMALLKKPPGPPQPQSSPQPKGMGKQQSSVVVELQAEFQREADAALDKDIPLVTLPDGSKAKVRSVKLPDTLT